MGRLRPSRRIIADIMAAGDRSFRKLYPLALQGGNDTVRLALSGPIVQRLNLKDSV